MDLHHVIFTIFIGLFLIGFFFVLETIHQFVRVDKKMFKHYIIAQISFFLAMFTYFIQYVIFPPLSGLEIEILLTLTHIFAIIGIYFIYAGTDFLSSQLNSSFQKNKTLYQLFLASIVALIIYEGFSNIMLLATNVKTNSIICISCVFFFISLVLALSLMLSYKKSFGGQFVNLLYNYIFAVILLISSSIIITLSLLPMTSDPKIFTDLAYSNNILAILGGSIGIMPFVISLRSVSKFRKLLYE